MAVYFLDTYLSTIRLFACSKCESTCHLTVYLGLCHFPSTRLYLFRDFLLYIITTGSVAINKKISDLSCLWEASKVRALRGTSVTEIQQFSYNVYISNKKLNANACWIIILFLRVREKFNSYVGIHHAVSLCTFSICLSPLVTRLFYEKMFI